MKNMTLWYLSAQMSILLIPTTKKEERALVQCLEKVIRRGIIILFLFSIIRDQDFKLQEVALQDMQYCVIHVDSSHTPKLKKGNSGTVGEQYYIFDQGNPDGHNSNRVIGYISK